MSAPREPVCPGCKVEFGVLTWKHECRSCCKTYCDDCSQYKYVVDLNPAGARLRVCTRCFVFCAARLRDRTSLNTVPLPSMKLATETLQLDLSTCLDKSDIIDLLIARLGAAQANSSAQPRHRPAQPAPQPQARPQAHAGYPGLAGQRPTQPPAPQAAQPDPFSAFLQHPPQTQPQQHPSGAIPQPQPQGRPQSYQYSTRPPSAGPAPAPQPAPASSQSTSASFRSSWGPQAPQPAPAAQHSAQRPGGPSPAPPPSPDFPSHPSSASATAASLRASSLSPIDAGDISWLDSDSPKPAPKASAPPQAAAPPQASAPPQSFAPPAANRSNNELTVKELKMILEKHGINHKDCFERQDLILKIRATIIQGPARPIDDDSCAICMDERSEVIFLNCGHLICCKQCAAICTRKSNDCPVCRQKIERIVEVYRSR